MPGFDGNVKTDRRSLFAAQKQQVSVPTLTPCDNRTAQKASRKTPNTTDTPMLSWLLNTTLMAVPFLIPVVIFMIARRRGFRWPIQKTLLGVAFLFYAASLLAFTVTAWQSNDPRVFFLAFYGLTEEPSAATLTGYALQGLAVVALMFVVNWKTIMLYKGVDDGSAQTAKILEKMKAKTEPAEAKPEEKTKEKAEEKQEEQPGDKKA